MSHSIKKTIKKFPLPDKIKPFLRRIFKPALLYLINLNTTPLSHYYGLDRGKPIDRFYIESFLEKNSKHIKGVCLELLNNNYTKKYGGKEIIKSDILDIEQNNQDATIVDDLRNLQTISDNTYDCIILTQVFQFIDNVESAVFECRRILKKGGVLLVTLPSISRIDCIAGVAGDFWRFTEASARYIFEKKFNPNGLEINSYGNAKTGMYFYAGLAQEDVAKKIFRNNDKNFPVIITVKAIKQ